MTVMDVAAKNAALDCVFGSGRGASAPSSFDVAFFAGDPEGSGVEIAGGGYARQAIANTTANWPAASGGGKLSAAVSFGTSWGAWSATATHVVLYASGTSTAWWSGPLSEEVSVTTALTTVSVRVPVFWNNGGL